MIGFLHPWALAGLAAAAIPILLHLLARREPPTVVFPAVRYLITTTREHQRRLKLQNLLLLLLRTLLDRRPRARGRGAHAPAPRRAGPRAERAGADRGQLAQQRRHRWQASPRLAQLRDAARAGCSLAPRRTTRSGSSRPTACRSAATRDAGRLSSLRWRSRPDGSISVRRSRSRARCSRRRRARARSCCSPTSRPRPSRRRSPPPRCSWAVPTTPPPPNVGIARLDAGPQPWSSEGGRVTRHAGRRLGPRGGRSPRGSVRRPPRQALAHVGGSAVTLTLPGVPSGWWTLSAELDPDELRADDRRIGVVRVAPVARVAWDTAARYVAAACEVLAANRRIARGDEVTFGQAGPGQLGRAAPRRPGGAGRAQSRARRARRGLELRRPRARAGDHRQRRGRGPGAGRCGGTCSSPSGSGRTGVLATVGGEPWMVRSGDVVLLGSRLDPAWTDLPVSRRVHALHGCCCSTGWPGAKWSLAAGRAGRSGAAARPRHRRAAGRARVAGGGRRLLPAGGRGRLLPRRRTRHGRRDQRQPRPAGVAAGPRAGRRRCASSGRARGWSSLEDAADLRLRRGRAGGLPRPAALGRAAARPRRGRAGEPAGGGSGEAPAGPRRLCPRPRDG